MLRRRRGWLLLAFAAGVAAAPAPARALDKQGSAHGGSVSDSGGSEGFDFTGALMLGVSLYNPSYAARPDNTGLALMRYAAHADVDLIGRKLSIPLDINMFTDKEREGLAKLSPTELDIILGVTSTWALGPGAVELGTRFENDRPVDKDGPSQSYVDARARYLFALSEASTRFAAAHPHTDVNGWLTFGWFVYNPSYFARPNNTGRALFRYAAHTELSLWDDLLSVGLDATFFTDRFAPNPLRPTELDLTPELIFHRAAYEVHLAYEIDMPLGPSPPPHLVQKYLYLLGVWSFDLIADKPAPLEHRNPIVSP